MVMSKLSTTKKYFPEGKSPLDSKNQTLLDVSKYYRRMNEHSSTD